MLNGTFKDVEVGQRFVKRGDLGEQGPLPIYEKISAGNARLVEGKNCTVCNGLFFNSDEPVVESLSLAPTANMLESLGHWSSRLFKEEGAYE